MAGGAGNDTLTGDSSSDVTDGAAGNRDTCEAETKASCER